MRKLSPVYLSYKLCESSGKIWTRRVRRTEAGEGAATYVTDAFSHSRTTKTRNIEDAKLGRANSMSTIERETR